jgi:hypothetical protein
MNHTAYKSHTGSLHRRTERSLFALMLIFASATFSFAGGDDVIREWNTEAVRRVVPSGSPQRQTRLMAIYSLAVHDAVNGITGKYETYLSPGPAPAGASAEAAAIAAGYQALCRMFASACTPLPDATGPLTAMFLQSLAANNVTLNDPGIGFGMAAANAMFDARINDGSATAQFNFDPADNGPGVWQPILTQNPYSLVPGWGAVTPFVLKSPSQFRPDPPPDIYSETFQRDLEEVRLVGRAGNNNCPRPDGLCGEVALFWRDGSPVTIWNQPLQTLVAAAGFDISTAARAYALVHTAGGDSTIACWEAKYGIDNIAGGYNYWRPQQAINFFDGNTSWTPYHNTPAHPEYPSGHSTNSNAMASILAELFGDNPGAPIQITVVSGGTPIQHTWSSFSEAVDEVIDARIYSGIHYRNTDNVGARLGGQVAQFVYRHALRECKGSGSCS